MASTQVSLTARELEEIYHLYTLAYSPRSKTAQKLERAKIRSVKEGKQ